MAGPSPARAPSSASSATPALSTRVTAARSKRRAPVSRGSALRQRPATSSRNSAPAKRSVSPVRSMLAVSAPGIGRDLAAAQVGSDLADRLVGELAVELLAERLHEGHALDHHVEHLPAAAGLAHQ